MIPGLRQEYQNFNPQATSPLVDKYLSHITLGNEEMLKTLKDVCKNSLLGTPTNRLYVFVNSKGSSGTTCFMQMMREIIECYFFEKFVADMEKIKSGYYGATRPLPVSKMIYCDSNETEHHLKSKSGLIKLLLAKEEMFVGDRIIKPNCQLVFICDREPTDLCPGLKARIVPIHFNACFTRNPQNENERQADLNIVNKIMNVRNNVDAFINWILS